MKYLFILGLFLSASAQASWLEECQRLWGALRTHLSEVRDNSKSPYASPAEIGKSEPFNLLEPWRLALLKQIGPSSTGMPGIRPLLDGVRIDTEHKDVGAAGDEDIFQVWAHTHHDLFRQSPPSGVLYNEYDYRAFGKLRLFTVNRSAGESKEEFAQRADELLRYFVEALRP